MIQHNNSTTKQQHHHHKTKNKPTSSGMVLYRKVENTNVEILPVVQQAESINNNISELDTVQTISSDEIHSPPEQQNENSTTPQEQQQQDHPDVNITPPQPKVKKQFVAKTKFQNFKNIDTLSSYQRSGLNQLLISFNQDHTINLILFINNYMRMKGKEFNSEFESVPINVLKDSIKQHLPKSFELFNNSFVKYNKAALCEAEIVRNLYISKKQSVLYNPDQTKHAPYFFKLYMFDTLRKNLRLFNLYSNKPCTSIGSFVHYNYIGMPRLDFYKLVKQIVTNEFREHFHYTPIEKEKTDNVSMWDIESYNFLKDQEDLKEGELIDNLPLMDLKNRLVIIQHMNEVSPQLWNIFLNNGKFPFVFDTEWNFYDPLETGVRLIQISNSIVCYMILVNFEEKPADYLLEFLFSPKFVKIGFALNGDIKRLNNWLKKHELQKIDGSFVHTPGYSNFKQGWVEADPHSVGLSKLVPFHTLGNQQCFYKFKGILEYYDYKWEPSDLDPNWPRCLKRIDYASMDVLIGYHYLKCEKYPSNHLFGTNFLMGWTERTWKEETKQSKAMKYSLLDLIYADQSLGTTKTRHFKLKLAYTRDFWKVGPTIPQVDDVATSSSSGSSSSNNTITTDNTTTTIRSVDPFPAVQSTMKQKPAKKNCKLEKTNPLQ